MTSGRHRALLLGALLTVLAACTRDAGSEAPTPDRDAYCEHLGGLVDLPAAFDQLDLPRLEELVPELTRAAAVAPAEVGDDVRLVADYAGEVLTAWQAAEPLDPATAASVFRELDDRTAAVEAAGKRLEADALEHCAIDLANPPTTTTTIPSTTIPTTEIPSTEIPSNLVPSPAASPDPTAVTAEVPDPAAAIPPTTWVAPSTSPTPPVTVAPPPPTTPPLTPDPTVPPTTGQVPATAPTASPPSAPSSTGVGPPG